jgi:hypothetical protein
LKNGATPNVHVSLSILRLDFANSIQQKAFDAVFKAEQDRLSSILSVVGGRARNSKSPNDGVKKHAKNR